MTSYQESDATSQLDNGDGLGCLVPLIGLTVALAIAVTLISWLWVDTQDEHPSPPENQASDADDTPRSTAEHVDSLLAEAERAHARNGVSSQALLEVVRSLGWRSFGRPDVYDLGSQQRVAHKFHRDDERIRLIVHAHKSEAATARALDQVNPPAEIIQFGSKGVVVKPLGETSRQTTASLAQRLRKFRDLLEQQDEQPAAFQ